MGNAAVLVVVKIITFPPLSALMADLLDAGPGTGNRLTINDRPGFVSVCRLEHGGQEFAMPIVSLSDGRDVLSLRVVVGSICMGDEEVGEREYSLQGWREVRGWLLGGIGSNGGSDQVAKRNGPIHARSWLPEFSKARVSPLVGGGGWSDPLLVVGWVWVWPGH